MVSVIITVYNKVNFVEECLNAVLAQDYPDYEVIIIDDGSSDGSNDICRRYADEYSKFTFIQANHGGVCKARNIGIKTARGDKIMFADADDAPLPSWIRTFAEQNTLLAISNYKTEYQDKVFPSLPSERLLLQAEDCDWLIERPNYLNHIWRAIYDAELIRTNNLHFHEEISQLEDILFSCEYLTALIRNHGKEQIVILDEPTYFHRLNDSSSLVKKRAKKDLGPWRKYMQACFDTIPDDFPIKEKWIRFHHVDNYMQELNMTYKLGDIQGIKQILKENEKWNCYLNEVNCPSSLKRFAIRHHSVILLCLGYKAKELKRALSLKKAQ